MSISLIIRSIAFAVMLGGLPAAGYAQTQENRTVPAFQSINASGAVKVFLTQGSSSKVTVEALPGVLGRIKTEVSGDVLKIYRMREGSFMSESKPQGTVSVYITCPRLTGLEVSGASDVKGKTPFTADALTIRTSGASKVTLTVTAKALNVKASGASDVKLAGRVERQQVQLSGSSSYHAYDLQSNQAAVEASGASDAYVAATRLASHATGASDIRNKTKSAATKQ